MDTHSARVAGEEDRQVPVGPAGAWGVTTRQVLASAVAVAALVVGLLFLWHARDVLLLIFAGVLYGIFLHRLARLVTDHTRLPRPLALVLVLLVLTGYVQDVLGRRDIRVQSH